MALILTTGLAGENTTIRIGNSGIAAMFIRGIGGATAGHLGTLTSLPRFRDEIKPVPVGDASKAILALRPGELRYKREIQRIYPLPWFQ